MVKETDNEIILDLQNLSSTDSEIELFKQGNGGSKATQTLYISIVSNFSVSTNVTVNYNDNLGNTNNQVFNSQLDLNDFVSNANTFFSNIFSFSIEYYSATESKMFVNRLNDSYQLNKISY